MAIVCDVAGMLDAESSLDDTRLLRVFLGRVRAWQEFMRKGAQALSPEAEIGLIGELTLLALIIEAGVPSALALEAWVGPNDGIQDFEIGTGAIEVKATLSPVGLPALIGSLVVLAPAGQRGQQAAVHVGGVDTEVAPDLLEVDEVDVTGQALELRQPAFKAQVAHATALKALGLEAGEAVRDVLIFGAQGPAGSGAQV